MSYPSAAHHGPESTSYPPQHGAAGGAPGVQSEGWLDWTYKGVDHSFPGNGGLECRDFLSLSQRYWESGVASLVALMALWLFYPRLRLPPRSRPCDPCCVTPTRASASMAQVATVYEPVGKRVLLLLMCLTFGIELGFKFATRRMIWIGNPCHLATMVQIFILSAPPSRVVTAAFRLHMHMLTGAPIAILFPVINTRLLPFESGVYFLQHILMLIIPFYCLYVGDPYIPEKLGDFSWAMMSFGLLFIYHFIPLQILAYMSEVNLNNMLCPAVSDPFHGRFYRLFAIGHQLVLIPCLGKVFVLLARTFNLMARNNPADCEHALTVIRSEDCAAEEGEECCSPCSPPPPCVDPCAELDRKSGCSPPSPRCRSSRGSEREFYRQRRYGGLDDDCPCDPPPRSASPSRGGSRPYYSSVCPVPCGRGVAASSLGNRCWSNTSGRGDNSASDDGNNDDTASGKTAEEEVEEDEDSGFLGATNSAETISTGSSVTNGAHSPAKERGGGGAEAEITRGSYKGQGEGGLQKADDLHLHQNHRGRFHEKHGDNIHYDSGGSTTATSSNGNYHQQRADWGDRGRREEEKNAEVNKVQHIVNGQMVDSKSGSRPGPHSSISERGGDGHTKGHGVRYRKSQAGDGINGSSSSNGSEIVVEGGAPRRVYDLQSCGNSSKVTDSVGRLVSGPEDDGDDWEMSDHSRPKVH